MTSGHAVVRMELALGRDEEKPIGSVSSGIEELFFKRDELNKQIQQEEEEKTRLQHDIRVLTEKLSRVSESLDRRLTTRNELDRTIAETEAAYMKVLVKSFLLMIYFVCLFYLWKYFCTFDSILICFLTFIFEFCIISSSDVLQPLGVTNKFC